MSGLGFYLALLGVFFFGVFGFGYSISHRKEILKLINIDRKVILISFLMLVLSSLIMSLIFGLNLELDLIEIKGINSVKLVISQIPKNIAVSFMEELIFRVFIFLGVLNLSGKKWIALVGSSLIFGFAHNPESAISIVSYFLGGLMYGLAFLKFESIWASVMLHFSWNYFQGSVFGFPVSNELSNGYFLLNIQNNVFWNGGEIGPEGSVLGIFSRLIIILFVLILSRAIKNDSSGFSVFYKNQ